MKVKVLQDFYDRSADLALRKADDELEATKERADYLVARGLAERIREPVRKKAKIKKE